MGKGQGGQTFERPVTCAGKVENNEHTRSTTKQRRLEERTDPWTHESSTGHTSSLCALKQRREDRSSMSEEPTVVALVKV